MQINIPQQIFTSVWLMIAISSYNDSKSFTHGYEVKIIN